MMADIRQKRINCVVVKDFSRFGRNYIETGNYIEKIFPFLNVRFIAVTDGYDSGQVTGDNLQLSMDLKNIVNELYARDIAQKVKAVKRMEQEKGSYIGGAPPYGYRVEKVGNRKVLVPDAATRRIVEKIFEMYAGGRTRREIVEELYREKVQRPLAYYATQRVYCPEGGTLQQWSYDTIKNILANPVYVGTLFQARTGGKVCQGRMPEHPMKTHEPLISEELFHKVSERFQKQSKSSNQKGFSKEIPQREDIFKDMVYCGRCGHRMGRNPSIKMLASGERVRRYYYACPNKNKIDYSACGCQGVSLRMLETIVKAVLEKEFACSQMRLEDDCRETVQEAEKKEAAIRKMMRKSIQKQEEVSLMCSKLYLRYREGEFPREAFLEKKGELEKELEKLNLQGMGLGQQETMAGRETEKRSKLACGLLEWGHDAELGRELVGCLIKKIKVYPKRRVEILFHYRINDLFLGKGTNSETA